MAMIPNERTVTLKLPRWMVCRVLVMLSAMSKNYLRPAWNEKVHDKVDASKVYAGEVFENK